MEPEGKLHALALSFIQGVGPVAARQLISYCGSVSRIFSASKAKLRKIPGIGEKIITGINNPKNLKLAEAGLKQLAENNCGMVFFSDPAYPKKLAQVNDAPLILFTTGNVNLNPEKSISIVGTRKATDYGKAVVNKLISGLAKFQTTIFSGFAYGIDISAHREAIKHQLPTIGIIGSGLDQIYPFAHKKYLPDICRDGGIITEYPFGTKPEAFNFPTRNRIIAGISDATIVVEASEKGGALITAEIANSYNKDVFAVPGPVDAKYSVGCHKLIKNFKANLVTETADLEYLLGWNMDKEEERQLNLAEDNNLTEEEKKVIAVLNDNSEMVIDEISWKSQLPVNRVASLLLNLEFAGYVNNLPGKKFKLAPLAKLNG